MKKIFLILLLFMLFTLIVFSEENEYYIDINKRYQVMEGFGASIAWYDNLLPVHPNKEEIYDTIFKELGLDILRLQNWYGKRDRVGQYTGEIVRKAEEFLGRPVKILISSWSPPEELKSNNDVENGGTLKKENGEYVYDRFADYWYDSLMAYEEAGIRADFISIQNEPDYKASWNSCLFMPEETEEYAGYDRALEAVYKKLHSEMENPPKILGPETIGIGYPEFDKYLEKMNLDYIYGIAHHLYRGGSHLNPELFRYNMNQLRDRYAGIPKFQTEFERGDNGLNTAWLIHNSLVEEDVNAYLYWDLIWDNGGLVVIENPWFKYQWRSEKGFYRSEEYYAFKHYSGFIHEGYRRVESRGSNNKVKISAFLSPAEDELIIVIVNTMIFEENLKLSIADFQIEESEIYESVFVKGGEKFLEKGSLNNEKRITAPAHSVITVRLKGRR